MAKTKKQRKNKNQSNSKKRRKSRSKSRGNQSESVSGKNYFLNNRNNIEDMGESVVKNEKEYKFYNKFIKYTKEQDKSYSSYKNNNEFIELVKSNPSVLMINFLFLKEHNKSFINELLKEENEPFYTCLLHYLHFSKLVKDTDEKIPIIEMLIKHGFHTIYDILLENRESFYLIAFLAHINSFGLIDNPNDFLVSLKKNKLYEKLRSRKLIVPLQKIKLYTRKKKWQVK